MWQLATMQQYLARFFSADGATALRSSGNTISYTPLGRAYNRFNPALGQTMNAAMLAVIYGDAIAPQNATELEIVRNPSHALS